MTDKNAKPTPKNQNENKTNARQLKNWQKHYGKGKK